MSLEQTILGKIGWLVEEAHNWGLEIREIEVNDAVFNLIHVAHGVHSTDTTKVQIFLSLGPVNIKKAEN